MARSTDTAADVLLTPRLRLQLLEARASHAALYRALYTCPRVMASIAPPMTEAEAGAVFARVCQHNRQDAPGHRTWAIESRETGEGLGIAALHRSREYAELGLMLRPQAWNGRASRPSLVAVIGHAFEHMGVERIDADCRDGPNARILRHLLLPLGFEPTLAARSGYLQWTLSSARWSAS